MKGGLARVADRAAAALSAVAFLGCLALPISNPDIFWHLSAARRMAELGAIPRADWLSSTMAGAPWTDFEWLAQLVFGALHHWGGMPALWGFKMSLLGACAAVLWATLALHRVALVHRVAALALWSAAFLTRSDIRPDLFSVLAFGLILLALESRRLGRGSVPAWWAAPFFCLWANLHAGFAYGLALIACYAVGETIGGARRASLWPHLAFAAAGTLAQPFGLGAYEVLRRHWTGMPAMSALIVEWGRLRLDNPWHWPELALLAGGAACAGVALFRRRRIDVGPLAAFLGCAVLGWRHARLAGYYATLALPLAAFWLRDAGVLRDPPGARSRLGAGAVCASCAAFVVWWGGKFGLMKRVFEPRYAPIRATAFLNEEREALGGRPLYNPVGWGGYLGWILYPRYSVFLDGRYIFNPLLAETLGAARDPAAWGSMLDRRRVEVAVLENIPFRLPTTRVYPDGSSRPFNRPYYVLFMPKERWALVHWDDQALIFVRRSAVPARWLAAKEFRYARPFDDDALGDALGRGEIPLAAVRAEFRRHDAEAESLARAPVSF